MPLNPESKLAQIRQAMADLDWDRAIKLAARFQNLGVHRPPILRAKDSLNNPRLYEQLGHDLAEIREQAIAALKERFSKSWEEAQTTKARKPNP